MFLSSSIIPAALWSVMRPRGHIEAIFATATAPFCRDRVKVKVLSVFYTGDPAYKVADVCVDENHSSWLVRVENLSNIRVFVTWEINSHV